MERDVRFCTCNDEEPFQNFLDEDKLNQLRNSALTVFQVKVIGGAGGPQPHGVHGVVHVAGDGCVVRHRQNHLQGKMFKSKKSKHL